VSSGQGAYRQIIERVFTSNHTAGASRVTFGRAEIEKAAKSLGLARPKNLGDVVYSFRFRAELPDAIVSTAPTGKQWVIVGEGDAQYSFTLFSGARITPRDDLEAIKIPASTPEIVMQYARGEEQALLAVLRYNRLIDLFLGVTAYSLQSHLRTKVESIGQMEIDEVYVGISKDGAQYIIPVQAKGGKDKQGVSQVLQDAEFCRRCFPALVPRLVAAQFVGRDRVAMLELVVSPTAVKVRNERHYTLVPASQISDAELRSYRATTSGN
jgi:hypothetical protein